MDDTLPMNNAKQVYRLHAEGALIVMRDQSGAPVTSYSLHQMQAAVEDTRRANREARK